MKDLFKFCNISRQGHHQNLVRNKKWAGVEYLLVGLILQTREVHPGMGLRTMYDLLKPEGLGRDAFISIGLAYGFRLITYKNPIRTTFSSPYSRYKNLLVDKKLDDINQLWTSDITYYQLVDKTYYIVMIMDVYSRKIIGYGVADNMRAENNCNALEMAFKARGQRIFDNLIHHSDRGGQYISNDYVELLNKAKIKISMCNLVHENTHIERVNGTVKNQYLRYWDITNFEDLKKRVKNTIDAYNKTKPHSSLQKLSPDSFEQHIKELDQAERPKMSIWTEDRTKNIRPNQCIIQF
jgi:transposase InsO family protein